MHNEDYVFVVYTSEEEAREAYEWVKKMRKDIKYMNKIGVVL